MNFLEILLVAFLGIYASLTAKKWSKINTTKRLIVVLSIICICVVAYNAVQKIMQDRLIENIYKTIGEIKYNKNVRFPALSIGGAEGGLFNPNGPLEFKTQDGKTFFCVYTIENKLFVNAIIRDLSGKIIAVIYNNEWKIYDKNNFEYNNDETGFEVVSNGERVVYFQVELKAGKANVSGLFLDETARGWCLFWDRRQRWGAISSVINGRMVENCMEFNLPIFKYPRERYLGIRVK
jgi:hypothetical protein